MAQYASPIAAMPQTWQPEQNPQPATGHQPAPADLSPTALGGSPCYGLRWYCKDVKSCTERWVAARQSAPARQPSPFVRTLAAVAPPPSPVGAAPEVPEDPHSIASLARSRLPATGLGGVIGER